MKTILSTLFLIFSINILTQAQETIVRYEKSHEINGFANCIQNIERFHDFKDCCIDIKLIECTGSFGSFPDEKGKDILFYNLYFRMKLLDKESGKTTIKNFWVEGGYHNPRNYKFEPTGRRLTFIHGTEKEPINISITFIETEVRVN